MYKLKDEFKNVEITVCPANLEKFILNNADDNQLEIAYKMGLEKYIEKQEKVFNKKSKK